MTPNISIDDFLPQLPAPPCAGLLPAPPIETHDPPSQDFVNDVQGDGSPMPPEPEVNFEPGQTGKGKGVCLLEVPSKVAMSWKMYNMPLYTGRKFVADLRYPDPQPNTFRDDWFHQDLEITIRGYHSKRMIGLGRYWPADPALSTALPNPDGTADLAAPLAAGTTYRINSFYPQPDDADLNTYDWGEGPYYTGPSSVRRLARELMGDAPTPREAVNRLYIWYRENVLYSKNGFPGSTSPIETFLFDSNVGNCQHFAGSMTLMLQSLGVLSRVVGGFASPKDRVYGGHAHAWVEVFFPDLGWVTFDPTNDCGIERDDDEDTGIGEEDGDVPDMDEWVPPEHEPIDFYNNDFEKVASWARRFAMSARRLVDEANKPKVRGAFETGQQVNTSQLYRMTTGDHRVYKRKKGRSRQPVKFILGYDESGSIRTLKDTNAGAAWNRVRFMLAEGLGACQQDFAVFGWNSDTEVYKRFGEPHNDRIRDKIVRRANRRIGGGTQTGSAVRLAASLARELGGEKTFALIFTDGSPSCTAPSVARAVEQGHADNMHTIGVILPHPLANRDKILQDNEAMFDRCLVLSNNETEVDEQLQRTLLSILRKA